MSRGAIIGIATIMGITAPALAQAEKAEPGKELIARTKKISEMDKNGCLKPDDDPVIVVCGESEDTKSQRVFRNQLPDPRHASGAAQNSAAAACIPGTGCIPPMKGGVKMGFGYVPPPAIPLEEVYRGLPEAEMVVEEAADIEPDGSIPPPQ